MKQISYDEVVERLSFKESIQVMSDCFAVGQTRNIFSVMEVGEDLYDSA